MARLVWTEPALTDLEVIAEYIALDNPDAAKAFVLKAFETVNRLKLFPKSGSIPSEIPDLPYRQVFVHPCRIFYRVTGEDLFIVFVMRGEQEFREEDLTKRK